MTDLGGPHECCDSPIVGRIHRNIGINQQIRYLGTICWYLRPSASRQVQKCGALDTPLVDVTSCLQETAQQWHLAIHDRK